MIAKLQWFITVASLQLSFNKSKDGHKVTEKGGADGNELKMMQPFNAHLKR
jgi:hypothetical protein